VSELFHIVEVNPNDAVGGGGCVCNEGAHTDCTGPYAVFPAQEMESNLSPHCVISVKCARQIVAKADGGDALAGGEKNPEPEVIDAEVVEDDVPEL
jgi:hypothetical protein